MKPSFLGRFLMAAVLVASAAIAKSKSPANLPQTDDQIANAVRHQIALYPYYSIFDDISFHVTNGQVELAGEVTQPVKKVDIGRLAQKVPGVTTVSNDVRVLPLSPFDNRLRLQVARAIYGDSVLSQYAGMAVPPIHIIVDNGHITLTGVVSNDMQKAIAGLRANGTGLSFGPVTNNLVVENPAKKS
jgi:hyperosmotically inducible protein